MQSALKTTTLIAALAACTLACIAVGQTPDPCEPVRIAPPAIVPPVDFGGRVAVDGDFWFISDWNARVLCPGDPFNCSAGAVHVYEMVDGRLEFRQMLTAPQPRIGDFYGRSIDAHQGRLAVCSNITSWPGLESRGGAFIYEFDGERWVEIGTIRPPASVDPRRTSDFGGMVVLEGDSAYIRPLNREFVFSYARRDGPWDFMEMIECPDGLPRDAGFGLSIAAHGAWVFISAARDSSITPFGGSVYAYRKEVDGTLTFVQKIVPTDVPAGPELTLGFGSDVSFDGQTLAIGAWGAVRGGAEHGAVVLYENVGGEWMFRQEVTHPATGDADLLGEHIEMDGGVLLATASRQQSPTASAGLHLFRRGTDGRWRYAEQLVPNPPIFASNYAYSIATDGRMVLAGANNDLDGTSLMPGAAYLFDLASCGCRLDLDADGRLTVFDFLTFLNLFQDGDMLADFDGDGELTVFDFLAFQTAFDVGCE